MFQAWPPKGQVFLCHTDGIRVTFRAEQRGKSRYNIFAMTNMSAIDDLAAVFQTLGQPARLQILLAIGSRETCVCHLEAVFGWRQAYLSQHLMALRRSGLLEARRAGRYIHYHLIRPEVLGIVRRAADLQGVTLPDLAPSANCTCSNCRQERGEPALPACSGTGEDHDRRE